MFTDQAKRVEEVQKAGEAYKEQLRGRIDRKMETYSENRSAQLNSITDRLKEHVSVFYCGSNRDCRMKQKVHSIPFRLLEVLAP